MAISINVRPISRPNTENRNSKSVMRPPPSIAVVTARGGFRKLEEGGSRRPGTKSLWLLPSGSDQVGDSAVRRLPSAHMGHAPGPCKFMFRSLDLSSAVHLRGATPAFLLRKGNRMPLPSLILSLL